VLRIRNVFALGWLPRPPIYSGEVQTGVNVDIVRELVSVHRPEFAAAAAIVPCGEGQDNVALDVDGELIVRFRKATDVAERAVFYARCSVLENLAYGRESGRPEYVDKSQAALSRLLAP
jgi:hypothetical protein